MELPGRTDTYYMQGTIAWLRIGMTYHFREFQLGITHKCVWASMELRVTSPVH